MQGAGPQSQVIPFSEDQPQAVTALFKRFDAAREQIDREIQCTEAELRKKSAITSPERCTLLDHLCTLKSRRNSVCPVRALPDEIICEIFVQDDKTFENFPCVCKMWRQIALDCPQLWSRIRPMPKSQFSVFLERSKNAPLDITLVNASDVRKFQSMLFPNLHRARYLNIAFDTVYEAHDVLQRSAPLLVSLILKVAPWNTFRHFQPVSSGAASAEAGFPNLFSGHAPRLRHVRLETCHVNWASPILSTLTSLSLVDIAVPFRLRLKEVLSILRRSSSTLVNLDLMDALSSASAAWAPGGADEMDVTSLPRLKSLNILSERLQCIKLYRQLSIRPPRSLRLVCTATDSSDTRYIMEWSDSSSSIHSSPHLDVIVPYDGDGCADVFVAFVAQLNAKESHELSIAAPSVKDFALTSVQWAEIGHTFPCLEAICLSGVRASALLSALTVNVPDDDSDDAGRSGVELIAYPTLRRLTFSGFSSLEPNFMGDLFECLMNRRRHGVAVETLSIERCVGVHAGDVQLLRPAVDRVLWDGD